MGSSSHTYHYTPLFPRFKPNRETCSVKKVKSCFDTLILPVSHGINNTLLCILLDPDDQGITDFIKPNSNISGMFHDILRKGLRYREIGMGSSSHTYHYISYTSNFNKPLAVDLLTHFMTDTNRPLLLAS